jgi:hypothetical protein
MGVRILCLLEAHCLQLEHIEALRSAVEGVRDHPEALRSAVEGVPCVSTLLAEAVETVPWAKGRFGQRTDVNTYVAVR